MTVESEQAKTPEQQELDRRICEINGLKNRYWWLNWITALLFWLGCITTAVQGLFSISSFIASLAAIPGMAFLSLTPFAFVIICSLVIAYYSIVVEQHVFRQYFERLLAQWFGVEYEAISHETAEELIKKAHHDNRTYNEKTRELIEKTREIDNHTAYTDNEQYDLSAVFGTIHSIFAHIGAVMIIALRAIVSIGSNMLGFSILLGLIAAPFGIVISPVILIPLCASTAAIGYFIKTSQNLVDQFNLTLKKLGLDRYEKSDYWQAKRQYRRSLERIYYAHIDRDVTSAIVPEEVEEIPTWQKFFYSSINIIFIAGALGASMQGFFSIDKFVSSLAVIPALSFLSSIPSFFIIGSSAVIATYTFFVEQAVLYKYFKGTITGWFKPDGHAQRYNVNVDNVEALRNDYKLECLRESIDYRIEQDPSGNSGRIIFTSEEAHKCYYYNNFIDEILTNTKITINTGERLTVNHRAKDWQKPKPRTTEYSTWWYYTAVVGSVFILLLRAVSSIGPNVLGLAKLANFVIAPLLGIAVFSSWVFLPCFIMATIGYFIKCSQNIDKHFYGCMKDIFGVEVQGIHNGMQYRNLANLADKLEDECISVLRVLRDQISDERQPATQPFSPTTSKSVRFQTPPRAPHSPHDGDPKPGPGRFVGHGGYKPTRDEALGRAVDTPSPDPDPRAQTCTPGVRA